MPTEINVMRLVDAVSRAASVSPELVLFARRPFAFGSDAVLTRLDEGHRKPKELTEAGFEYLLGVEDIRELMAYLESKRMSLEAKAEFIVHYAMTDSTPKWIDDIPSI